MITILLLCLLSLLPFATLAGFFLMRLIKTLDSLKEKEASIRMLKQELNQSIAIEEAIHIGEEKLLSMVEGVDDGLFMVDTNQKVNFINDAASTILNLPLGFTPQLPTILAPLSQTVSIGSKIQQSIAGNKKVEVKEVVVGNRTLNILISPIIGLSDEKLKKSEKKIIGAVVVMHDISLEKSLEKLKENFTHSIVHELRSPTAAIKSAAELILMDKTIPLKENQKVLIEIIDKQSKRMLSDIATLLDAAKMQAGRFSVWQAPIDIRKLLIEDIDLFTPQAKEKNVSITTDIPEHLPFAFIDAQRIDQVVTNLISNSLKFTPEGGNIHVTAKYQLVEHLPKTPTNPGIVVSVADTGAGIPLEKQPRLFKRFSQLSSDGHDGLGTGLGLYITKGIVEAHKGTIMLQSTEGKGTIVTFTLPIAQHESATSAEEKPLATSSFPTKTLVN